MIEKFRRKAELSPEELLLKSPHIKKIIHPDSGSLMYENAPIELQFKNIIKSVKLQDQIKKRIEEAFIGYINAPVIEDDFEDDRDRNEFENSADITDIKGQRDRTKKFYQSNRLRITNIRHILGLADLLTYTDVLTPGQKDELKKQMEDLWATVADRSDESKRKDNFEGYYKMTLQDKIAATEKTFEFAKKVIVDMIKTATKK